MRPLDHLLPTDPDEGRRELNWPVSLPAALSKPEGDSTRPRGVCSEHSPFRNGPFAVVSRIHRATLVKASRSGGMLPFLRPAPRRFSCFRAFCVDLPVLSSAAVGLASGRSSRR